LAVISTPRHVERLVQPEQAVKVVTENEIEAAFSTLAKEQASGEGIVSMADYASLIRPTG
jgi:hypothetical protein